MSEWDRLLDDAGLDADEAKLLRAARAYRSSEQGKRGALVALGLAAATAAPQALAATAVTSGIGAASSGSMYVVAAKWLTVCALAGLTTAGVIRYTHPVSTPALPAPQVQAVAQLPTVDTTTSPPSTSGATDPSPPEQEGASPARVPESPTRTRRSVRSVPPQGNEPSLAAEVAALDEVRSALLHRDGAGALSLLSRYQRDFPRPTFGPEAVVLRVEALVQRGDVARARALAERFLAKTPRGSHADRIRSLVGMRAQANDGSTP